MRLRVRPVLIVLVGLALAMFACNFGAAASNPASAGQAPASTTAPGAAPPINPPSGDARQVVIDAFTKLESAYPYRLTETDSGGSCAQELRKVEFASKDEWHSTWSGCLTGESISTGGKMYYLVNGAWSDTGTAPPGLEQQADIADMVKAALQNVQTAGSESLNGVPANVYTFDLNDPVLNIKGGKVWIGAADGLPHQAQAQYSVGEFSVSTQLVYEFGIPVNIQAPIP